MRPYLLEIDAGESRSDAPDEMGRVGNSEAGKGGVGRLLQPTLRSLLRALAEWQIFRNKNRGDGENH